MLPQSRAKRTGVQAKGALRPTYKEFDDRTTAQLQEQRFSGLRANDLWNRFEIWILGHIETTVTYQEFFVNPDALNTAYCNTFGLHEMTLDDKNKAEIERAMDKKRQLQDRGIL